MQSKTAFVITMMQTMSMFVGTRGAEAFLHHKFTTARRVVKGRGTALWSASSVSACVIKAKAAASSNTEKMRQESEQEMQKVVELYTSSPSFSMKNIPTLLTTPAETAAFINDKIDTLLFDCDGVIYRAPDPCPEARECIQSLLDRGKQIYFVTNNAGSNRLQLREKLQSILQLDCLTEEMMISSSYSCAQYLKRQVLDNRKKESFERIFVIGSAGLCEELRETGFDVTGGPSEDDTPSSMTRDELAAYEFPEHPIDAVVVGHDTDFNFRKLCIANILLQWNPDAMLVATNRDSFDLVGADARKIPGNGCVVTALEYCSQRQAINVGKPSSELAQLMAEKCGLDPARSLFVGDRLDTDIRFGIESGMYSALVMTGVTTAEQLKALKDGTKEEPLPSHILPHIGLMAD